MIKKIMNEFSNSKREKEDRELFASKVFIEVQKLYAWSELLANSEALSIEIGKESVFLNIENKFKMIFNKNDIGDIPISILCFKEYERQETEMVLNIVRELQIDKRDITVFDVGANMGWYTLNILKEFPQARVYSFEPSPVSFSRLEKNLIINQESTNSVFNIGFYDVSNSMDFYYDEEASGASSLVELREKGTTKKITVDLRTMDEWSLEHKVCELDFVKCDVEGAEYFVYKGGFNMLRKCKPIIFSEMLRKWSAKFGYHPNDIINLLSTIGYRCYVITSSSRLKECLIVDETTVETNYFFLHTEKHDEIVNKFLVK